MRNSCDTCGDSFDKHSHLARRHVEAIAGVHTELLELLSRKLGMDEAAVRAGELQPHGGAEAGDLLEHRPESGTGVGPRHVELVRPGVRRSGSRLRIGVYRILHRQWSEDAAAPFDAA